ncbi:MAG: hypothetical protein LBR70_01110 [Lactobacillaceae bacterium]|jgi:RNAse (barnase) inhibitor barstar|nr:hypothetical protein [Lactobacillaceae bacterium]
MRAVKFSIFLFALTALLGPSAHAACNPQTGEGCTNFSSRVIEQQRPDFYYNEEQETALEKHYREREARTAPAAYQSNESYGSYPRRASHNSRDSAYSQSEEYVTSREDRILKAYTGQAPKYAPVPQKDSAPRYVQGANSDNAVSQRYYDNQQPQRISTADGYYNPKDGSMFPGGRCDNGNCNKDGSIFGGGCSIPKNKCMRSCKQNCGSPMTKSCEQSCKPCFKCNEVRVAEEQEVYQTVFLQDYIVKQQDEVYDAIHKCKDLAPLELKYVDFRIKKDRSHTGFSERLGNYRFRIFGCRRFDKHAMLNQGRVIQKDLQFIRIFEDMVSDCLNIVKTPEDLCSPENKEPLPEYVLTAEITDYFMNVCDKYSWDDAKKENLRTGSSEMTVTWRLTNATGSKVMWKGETTGYAELDDGEYNGEIVLLERAFADAVNTLRQLPGFEDQLAKRVSAEDLARQRQELIELEKIANPAKCQFQEEIKIVKECSVKTVCVDIDTCTGETTTKVKDKEIIKEVITVTEDGGSNSTASVTIEKDIIEITEDSGVSSSGQGAIHEEIIEETITKTIIDEDSGVLSSGQGAIHEEIIEETITKTVIDEDSGILSPGQGAIHEEIVKEVITKTVIDEDSGVLSSGQGAIHEEITKTTVTETIIDENSGVLSSGQGGIGETITTTRTETIIDETSGILSSGSGGIGETITFEVVENVIDENSGILSSGIGENSGSLSSGAFTDELWIDLPVDNGAVALAYTGETGDIEGSDDLCIVDRAPYETLSAENVYKIRSSVVNITNANGKAGAGLIISNYFILTSADLIVKTNNSYDIETINGIKLKASAFRINPNKNTALLVLNEKTRYNPLPLNLYLPQTGRGGYLTLGMLNQETIKGKLEDKARIAGYRYTDDIGAEIIVNTDVQKSTIGGALIDDYGTISGISHTSIGTDDGNDLFLPITSALKSVGVSICGKAFPEQTPIPWYERSTTPVSKAIDNYKAPKAPKAIAEEEVK